MKRLTAVLLLVVLIFSAVACSEEQKAEKYCWNCGEGITKKASFCEHCGATIKNENDNSTTEENISTSNSESTEDITSDIEDGEQSENSNASSEEQPTESSEDALSSTPEESNVSEKPTEPETPTHTHSYSKKVTSPTCTEQGYTTYTCSCGDTYVGDKTTAKGHSYTSGKCSVCDVTDSNYVITYGLGETWIVAGQWEFSIKAVTEHYLCNKYNNSAEGYTKEKVYIVEYTYKNLGYDDKLWFNGITNLKAFDDNDFSIKTYSCSHTVGMDQCFMGTAGGSKQAFVLSSESNSITIYVSKETKSSTEASREITAKFVVPLN